MNLSTDADMPLKKPKFMFGVTFEDDTPLSPIDSLRAAGMVEQRVDMTVTEFETAKAQSFADGVNAGKAEAASSQQAQLNFLLTGIGDNLTALTQYNADQQQRADETMAMAIRAIAQKLLPNAVAQSGLTEIEALAVKVISELREEARLVIRVADMHAEACAARLPAIAKKIAFQGQLIIIGEPALGPADCRIEWADGGMERLDNAIWSEIDRVLAKYNSTGTNLRADQVYEYQQEQKLMENPHAAPTTNIIVEQEPTEGDDNGSR